MTIRGTDSFCEGDIFMVWLNVDKPTTKITLHTDNSCYYVQTKGETSLKGLGDLKIDGGWLSFSSKEDVRAYCQSNFPQYKFTEHC